MAHAGYSTALLVVSLIALAACSHDAPLECGSFTLVFPPVTATDETTGQPVCDATVQIVATDGGGEDGDAAGPMALQHFVDTTISLECRDDGVRVLPAVKNRFGATCREYPLAMTERGLVEYDPDAERPPIAPLRT